MPSKSTSVYLACLSGALAFCATASLAQQGGDQNNLSAGDKKFLTMASEGNAAEISLGNLALQKSSNPDVKEFAQRMVDDHTKLQEQAKPVAEQLGVTPPSQPSAKQQALMTKLQAANGADFDKQYAHAMVEDHREDDKEFKKEETSGKNQSVKDLATQGEPIIAQHLQMAEALDKKVK